jgi:hypothetical protein
MYRSDRAQKQRDEPQEQGTKSDAGKVHSFVLLRMAQISIQACDKSRREGGRTLLNLSSGGMKWIWPTIDPL